MLRKLLSLMIAVGMLSFAASSATAGFFLPKSSYLEIQLGTLDTITVQGTYALNGWATLTGAAPHGLTDTDHVWATLGNAVGTSLLTGVSLLDRLTLTGVNLGAALTPGFSTPNPVGGGVGGTNPSLSGTLCPGGCLGGAEGFNGRFILNQTPALVVPLTNFLGVGGQFALPLGQASLLITAAPFITGKARITNINTNVVSMPNRNGGLGVTGIGVTLQPTGMEEVKTFTQGGGFITTGGGIPLTQNTAVIGGFNDATSVSGTAQIQLISPMRIDTGPLGVGVLPAFVRKTFVFVPEPGTVLLLVSGAAGLAFIGRKRMKR